MRGAPCDGCRGAATTRRRETDRGRRLQGGDSCRKLWVVRKGFAGLCTVLEDGRRQILHLMTDGDVVCPFGVADGVSMWLEAFAPSEICEIDVAPLAADARQTADMHALLFPLAHQQLLQISSHVVVLGRLDAMERICLFLADMAHRFGQAGPSGHVVSLPLRREDIADYLGLNAETVSRLLTKLKKSGLVVFINRSDFLVKDVDALEARAPIAIAHQSGALEAHAQ